MTLTQKERLQIGVGAFEASPRAKQLVAEVLASGRLSAGPMTARFEREVAELHGCKFGVFCNSGTSALQIALAALKERHGWQDGDEVLVPAVTFVATANVVLYNGLKPVFVDVEPDYYCIDPSKIEERVTPRTRALIPVHIAGLPAAMGPVREIAQARSLRIVEDACEAMFAACDGQAVGSFGDIGCFSTYVAHVITTGVGGLCTTDDAGLVDILKSLMNHGRDSVYTRIDDDRDAAGAALLDIAQRRFSFVRLGHSFRATEMEAALGVAQLEQRNELLARRAAIAARFTRELSDLQEFLFLPSVRAGARHVWMFYPLRVRNGVSRGSLIAFLENHGIETRYLLPLINQPVYRRLYGDLDAQYPVAAELNGSAFYIGCPPEMKDGEADYVIERFHEYFRNRQ
jgi:dTDP-4-amino-4,6-dideoxygalactose transaminase